MIVSWGIILNARSANSTLITDLIAAMPTGGAEDVRTSYHNIPTSFTNIDGEVGMSSRADFDVEATRDSVMTALKALDGVSADFLPGSWIRAYNTDDSGNDTLIEEAS